MGWGCQTGTPLHLIGFMQKQGCKPLRCMKHRHLRFLSCIAGLCPIPCCMHRPSINTIMPMCLLTQASLGVGLASNPRAAACRFFCWHADAFQQTRLLEAGLLLPQRVSIFFSKKISPHQTSAQCAGLSLGGAHGAGWTRGPCSHSLRWNLPGSPHLQLCPPQQQHQPPVCTHGHLRRSHPWHLRPSPLQ